MGFWFGFVRFGFAGFVWLILGYTGVWGLVVLLRFVGFRYLCLFWFWFVVVDLFRSLGFDLGFVFVNEIYDLRGDLGLV